MLCQLLAYTCGNQNVVQVVVEPYPQIRITITTANKMFEKILGAMPKKWQTPELEVTASHCKSHMSLVFHTDWYMEVYVNQVD